MRASASASNARSPMSPEFQTSATSFPSRAPLGMRGIDRLSTRELEHQAGPRDLGPPVRCRTVEIARLVEDNASQRSITAVLRLHELQQGGLRAARRHFI